MSVSRENSHQDHDHLPRDHHLLLWPLLATALFAIVEAVGGWLTGSLALLGDAGHMASDAAALALALLGSWVASRPPSAKHSFGLMRAEVMVALLNGLLMLMVIATIAYEAIERMQSPQPVNASGVMLIAVIGLLVNIAVAMHLHRGQHNINHRAALLHVIGDLLGSIAALMAGVIIYFTGWVLIDPILSLFISLLILVSTVRLLRDVLHMLMEGVPHHLDVAAIERQIAAVPEVAGVHHLYVWSLSSELVALSAHIVLEDREVWPQTLQAIRQLLREQFAITHITLQPELSDTGNQDQQGCWLEDLSESQ